MTDDLGRLDALAVNLRPANTPPVGVVAVTADEAGRFTRFAVCMQSLLMPYGSKTVWQVGNDIAGNRNGAVENMLSDSYEWVWFIDDDHTFSPDVLQKLLARNVDIVTPLCLRRQEPFLPVACVDDDFMDLSRYDKGELVEVQHAGSSGMLVRRHVLEALEQPWFVLGNGVSEDVNFCAAARAAGLSIHVDLACWLGHLTIASVQAFWHEANGRWMTGFTVADGAQLAIDVAPSKPPVGAVVS